MREKVYSICAMCTVRCPIMVEVEDGVVRHIWGNPNVFGGLYLCPRGAAGKVFQYDSERPQHPLIRDGERGTGKWKKATWDQALDYIAEKLGNVRDTYGARSIALSDRGGPITDFQKTFITALGSPNYFTHHASCSNSVHNAHMSVSGYPRNGVGYDYKNCKYMVVFGRNLLESIETGEAKNVIDMQEAGGKLVYIDVRWNYTAAKADKFFIIRPGSDYALTLALLNVIVRENLYDSEFVNRWVTGLEELKKFVLPYIPEWAEKETGISAREIIRIAHEASEACPSVIFHPGWMTAWKNDDYYLRRAIYCLNALMGCYEAKGGIFINKTPADVGITIQTLISQVPKVNEERFDGCGTKYPHLDAQWGLAQMLPHAILSEDPYPVKAYIAMRHDPLASLPDPEMFRKALSKLDLLVSIDVNYSETGWFSDVILPESTYLERTDHVVYLSRSGVKPFIALRKKAVEPRFDSRPRSHIFKALADKLGAGQYFPYNSIEELLTWQLEGTGLSIQDFDSKGVIELVKRPLWWDRKEGIKFKTPSGKIEIISSKLESNRIPSFIPYEAPVKLGEGFFRLVTSKSAVHTQGRTTSNNPILHEIVFENHLWINTEQAELLGIQNGDVVEVSVDGVTECIKAQPTDFIHPEAVFMLHGFGDSVPLRTRSFGKGVSDVKLQKGLLKVGVGGNCPMTECIVSVKPASLLPKEDS
ncbi:MAG: molybdopterin-dependent oxidoreductase [Dissulfurispiraceae bacterium]